MLPADRQRRQEVDHLVEEYTQRGMSRREFLKRAAVIGLSASAAGTLLAACGGGSGGTGSSTVSSNSVDVLTVWGGEELDSFNATLAPFKQQTGISVKVESTRDLTAELTTRIKGNNPPDIADLPNPALMTQLASQNKLVALDDLIDISTLKNDYSSTWVNLGSYNGKVYALFYKAANKATVWYDPSQFTSNGWTTPTTWTDLINLSNTIANSGKYPWTMGFSSGASSGWPGADWVDQIFLMQSGPTQYDKWVNHQIPWTDPSVKSAFQAFGQIANGNSNGHAYIQGGSSAILATGFQQASYGPFQSPPASYLYYLGDFTEGFITSQFPNAKAGTDFNYFAFPNFGTAYDGAVTGGADVLVALRNTTAVKKLMAYLETAQAQEIWIKRGGFTSVNKNVPFSSYPDPIAQASAKQLVSAPVFRFGADDLMPTQMEDAFWKAMLAYVQNPGSLDSILSGLESTAGQAYSS